MGKDERHYNIEKLNFLFAIAALVLLAALVMMFAKDYLRPWKKHQAEFRGLELEKTRMKYDKAYHDLENDAEYQELLGQVAVLKKEYEVACSGLGTIKKDLNGLIAQDKILDQKYKFAKAEMDAVKYRYETAKSHADGHIEEVKKEYIQYFSKVNKLNLEVEQSKAAISEKQGVIDQCSSKLNESERAERQFSQKKTLLLRKLQKTDPIEMSFVNQIAQMVRDMPVVDLANPNNKIDQIVLKDITDDVNFLNVPKVDRCVTCHKGVTNPDYIEAPQPFTTHPNLEQYVGVNSPHPIEEFGCTVCHGGRGRGTSFSGAAHTPKDAKQEEEWRKKYNWEKIDLWEEPMLPIQHVEAGCFKCHDTQDTIKGADDLNLGLNIIERAGCYNCHNIDKYKNWPKTGPDLTKLSSKIDQVFAYNWIKNPKAFRHNAWMPTYFNQSNNSDLVSAARSDQEIHALVKFLFSISEDYKLEDLPLSSDAKNGERLVASLGCLGCHQVDPLAPEISATFDSLSTQHGPNLTGLGTKTSKNWLYNWLKDPKRYHPSTRMPDLRLTDAEASDIADYLTKNKNDQFGQLKAPPVNEEIVNQIVKDFLLKNYSHVQADKKIADMNVDQKLIFAGENLVGQMGCYACHEIKGFENRKPIGVDLTQEGSKSLHNLDFGFQHDLPHTKQAWFKQKLKDPRIFDAGKIKSTNEKLIMPNFYLTDNEISSLTTALLGFVKDNTVARKKKPVTPRSKLIDEGQKVIKEFNCKGCHVIEDQGGTISNSLKNWMVTYLGKDENEAKALLTSMSPPNLIGEGSKVQSHWLFGFLDNPTPIRPWLTARMPSYHFSAGHLNDIVKYFSALDNADFPFSGKVDYSMTDEERGQAEKLFSKDYFGCAQCHIVGSQMPNGSTENWAPNFSLSKDRLRPEWIVKWILNPAAMLPGTKMPSYFDEENLDASGPEDLFGGDEKKQIEMLRNYLMTIDDDNAPGSGTQKINISPEVKDKAAEMISEIPSSLPSEANSVP